MSLTAILVDGGFYRKRAAYLWGKKTAENRALIETYGKQVNFIDFGALEAVVREIQHEKTPHYCEVSNAEDGT